MIDFEKTLTLLSDAGVRFVIVGGLAVTIHGSAYVTFDLDICYARDGENLACLASASDRSTPACAARRPASRSTSTKSC